MFSRSCGLLAAFRKLARNEVPGITIKKTGIKTTAALHDNQLTDSSGQIWVLQESTAHRARHIDTLDNQDILKMVKAGFDDAIIIAKISSSNCQFDTSPDALIQLKKTGAGAPVLKAMPAAKK